MSAKRRHEIDEKNGDGLAELLALVGRFSEDLSATESARGLVRKFRKALEEILPGSSALLALSHGEGLEMVFASGDLKRLHGTRFATARARKLIRRGMRSTRLVHELDSLSPFEPQAKGTRAVLLVPLRSFREELGGLWIELPDPTQATPTRQELVRILGNEFALAYRSLVLHEQTGYLRSYLQGLFESTNAAILVLDDSGRVRLANSTTEHLLQARPGELAGRQFFDLVSGGDGQGRWRELFARVLKQGHVSAEPVLLEVNGAVRSLVLNASPIEDGKEKVREVLFVGLDVTETATLRERLNQSEKLASLGEMAAGIAHEINSPLMVLGSAADLLIRGAERLGLPTDELRRPAAFVNEAVDRLQSLASNLLSYARPANQEQRRPVDVNKEIDRALSFSQYELTRGGVQLVTELGKNVPKVLGIPNELQQIFINLLHNARDAMAPLGGGTVKLRTTTNDAGTVIVEVSDEGPGIPEEFQKQIFDPFFTTKTEGSGLGLHIVHGVVERHGGKIEVDSSHRGTTFRIEFPSAKAARKEI